MPRAVPLARSPKRKADAILAADIHITDRVPLCRNAEEFRASMFTKLDFIHKLQGDHGEIPVLVAGDVTARWHLPPWILREAIHRIFKWIVIPGQHDLPQHRLEAYSKSALAVLEAAGCLVVLGENEKTTPAKRTNNFITQGAFTVHGFPWSVPIANCQEQSKRKQIALAHHFVYTGTPPFPNAANIGTNAPVLLKRMKGFDLIVTGDNHTTFTYPNGSGLGKFQEAHPLLVNPGAMLRLTAAQVNHEPCVFLWYAADNTVERIVLPHQKEVISREHIDPIKDKDAHIEAFISRLRDDIETGLDYRKNLRQFMEINGIPQGVRRIIWEVLDGEYGTDRTAIG